MELKRNKAKEADPDCRQSDVDSLFASLTSGSDDIQDRSQLTWRANSPRSSLRYVFPLHLCSSTYIYIYISAFLEIKSKTIVFVRSCQWFSINFRHFNDVYFSKFSTSACVIKWASRRITWVMLVTQDEMIKFRSLFIDSIFNSYTHNVTS